MAEISARIGELESISKSPGLLKSLEIKVARAAATTAKDGSVEKGIKSVSDRIAALKKELTDICKRA